MFFSPRRFVAHRCAAQPAPGEPPHWLKGNLHTHSLWSDGDDYPEMIVDWYKQHQYNFLALSDHNTLLVGQKWTDPATNKGGPEALKKYIERFGTNWVEQAIHKGKNQVRLKTLEEFRASLRTGSFC